MTVEQFINLAESIARERMESWVFPYSRVYRVITDSEWDTTITSTRAMELLDVMLPINPDNIPLMQTRRWALREFQGRNAMAAKV